MGWQIGKQINSAFSVAVEQPPGWGKAGKALGIEAVTLGNGVAQQEGGLALNIRAPWHESFTNMPPKLPAPLSL